MQDLHATMHHSSNSVQRRPGSRDGGFSTCTENMKRETNIATSHPQRRDMALQLVQQAQTTLPTSIHTTNNEIDSLRIRVVQLEYELTKRDEELAKKAESEMRLLRERLMLTTRIQTMMEELDGARKSEVMCRKQTLAAEAAKAQAEAATTVSESRLDAAARREAALQLALRSQTVVNSEWELNQCRDYEVKLAELQQSLEFATVSANEMALRHGNEMTELRKRLERSDRDRVDAEVQLSSLETRFGHVKMELDTLSKRTSSLVSCIEEKELAMRSAQAQVHDADVAMKQAVNEAWTQASRKMYSCKRIVEVVKQGLDDLICVMAVIEATLNHQPVDVKVLFQKLDHNDDDVEHITSMAELAFAKVVTVKDRLIKAIAMGEGISATRHNNMSTTTTTYDDEDEVRQSLHQTNSEEECRVQ